jgi:putative DNA primase/helicase
MDPHRLARNFVADNYRDSQKRVTLAFWRGEFWSYENGCYRRKTYGEMAAQLTSAIKKEVDSVPLLDRYGRAHVVTKGTIANVTNALTGTLYVPDTLEQPAWIHGENGHTNYLAMRNGLLDLREADANVLRPLTPNWFSAVCLPYDYDAAADCPQWHSFLNRVLEGDAERIELLQQWFGYLLTPDTSLHAFMVLEGEGANGKSVVLEVVEAMVGHANVSHVPVEVFGDRFQLTMTDRRLVNIASEVNDSARLNEGVLKQFTGGDAMYFDRKGIPGFDAKPTARLMMATNNRPPFSDRSDGIWRRILHLPFRVTIPVSEQNPNLAQQLKTEVAGILNWALEGRRRLNERGRFITPAESVKALQEYRRESNPAAIFLREHCHRQVGARVGADIVFLSYQQWAKDNGHVPLNSGQFGKEVVRAYRDVTRVRGSRADGSRPWLYQGIALGLAAEDEVKSAA